MLGRMIKYLISRRYFLTQIKDFGRGVNGGYALKKARETLIKEDPSYRKEELSFIKELIIVALIMTFLCLLF